MCFYGRAAPDAEEGTNFRAHRQQKPLSPSAAIAHVRNPRHRWKPMGLALGANLALIHVDQAAC